MDRFWSVCLLLICLLCSGSAEGVVPAWVKKIPQHPDFLFAVGWGGTREQAAEGARVEIAQSIQVEISSVVSTKIIEVQIGGDSHIEEIYRQQVESITRQSPSGAEVQEYCEIGPGRYACLVRLPRAEPGRIVEQQQERLGNILAGFLAEGEKAAARGKLGMALKNYFKAYSILPLLPRLLYLPRGGEGGQEAHSLLFNRVLGLLEERECDCEYEQSGLGPDQGILRLTLHGKEPGSWFGGLPLKVRGVRAVETRTGGKGDFALLAEDWRERSVVQFKVELLPQAFVPYEEFSGIQKEQFHNILKANFPRMDLEVICTLAEELRIFVQVEESIDGASVQTGALAQALETYISDRPSLWIAEQAEEADLRLSGRLQAFFRSSDPDGILGDCYQAGGRIVVYAGEQPLRHFVYPPDSRETESFHENPRMAGMGALRKVSRLLLGDIQVFLGELGAL